MLTFQSFDVDGVPGCTTDYVQIIFGSVAEKYCGSNVPNPSVSKKPGPTVSSGNTMTVFFHSSRWSGRPGFKATWKAVETSGILSCFKLDCFDFDS